MTHHIQALTTYPSLLTRQEVGLVLKQICIQWLTYLHRSHSFTLHFTNWSKESLPDKKAEEIWTRLQVLERLITIHIYIMRSLFMIYSMLLVAHTVER